MFSTPCDDRSTATSASREFPGHDCRKYKKSCSLILFFSKSLLRHPLARSNIEELAEGTKFIPYIPEPQPESLCAPEDVKRHIICSGQVYYQLLQERENRKLNNVAISRMEQISPVPYALVTPHLDTYPNADLMWAQEEPVRALSPLDLRGGVADYSLRMHRSTTARGATCSRAWSSRATRRSTTRAGGSFTQAEVRSKARHVLGG
jgi:2-oxoglutarate dehydrogenase complex dehydrogenase (E1) component-like enzyme